MEKNQTKCLIGLFLIMALSVKSQEYVYPVIQNYGGVVHLENAIFPSSGGKIIVDLTSAEPSPSGFSRSMDRLARLINLYGLAEISPDQLEMTVIVHGAATKMVLAEEAYLEAFGTPNPDTEILQALREHGVKFLVCGQAYTAKGYSVEALNPDVRLALSAITTLVAYQQDGYVVLYF